MSSFAVLTDIGLFETASEPEEQYRARVETGIAVEDPQRLGTLESPCEASLNLCYENVERETCE